MKISLVFMVVKAQHENESIICRLYFMKTFSAERAFLGCGPRNQSLECNKHVEKIRVCC